MSERDPNTLLCLECGGEMNPEPGPQLCGPCWVTLGCPTVWPPAKDTADQPSARIYQFPHKRHAA